jgi:hypothetical protein
MILNTLFSSVLQNLANKLVSFFLFDIKNFHLALYHFNTSIEYGFVLD